ncbi:MAG: HD domain-containing protein, partial [Pseudomonadota bacterium]
AIAEDADGTLIDPFGGQRDLAARTLRHVSPAFSEDPVRILRAARFAARFAALGFTVAAETMTLMRAMVDAGEVDALVPDRVWQETRRALDTDRPDVFFTVLRECGALAVVFPELDRLWGVPQPARWHPEVDAGEHTLHVLRQAVRLSDSAPVRFAALVHDLGKAETPAELLPRHHGHEARSAALVKTLCARLRVPNEFRDLALLVAEHHGTCHRARELRAATVVTLLEKTGALRHRERFVQLLLACEADARGRPGHENEPYPQAELLRAALDAAATVTSADVDMTRFKGPQIAAQLHQLRVAAVKRQRKTSGA